MADILETNVNTENYKKQLLDLASSLRNTVSDSLSSYVSDIGNAFQIPISNEETFDMFLTTSYKCYVSNLESFMQIVQEIQLDEEERFWQGVVDYCKSKDARKKASTFLLTTDIDVLHNFIDYMLKKPETEKEDIQSFKTLNYVEKNFLLKILHESIVKIIEDELSQVQFSKFFFDRYSVNNDIQLFIYNSICNDLERHKYRLLLNKINYNTQLLTKLLNQYDKPSEENPD